jgi:hypothetical protein
MPVPRLTPAELPACTEKALSKLISWHEKDSTLGMDSCGSTDVSALNILYLGLAALSIAKADPTDKHVAATLHLARDVRQCGPIIYAMVGFVLADNAVRWARDRHAVPVGPFRTYRPKVDEVLPALAREPVCTLPLWEAEGHGRNWLPWFLRIGVPEDREYLIYKKYHSDKLLKASQQLPDLAKVAHTMNMSPSDLPKNNIVILTTAGSYAHQIGRMDAIIKEYESFLENE